MQEVVTNDIVENVRCFETLDKLLSESKDKQHCITFFDPQLNWVLIDDYQPARTYSESS